MLYRRLGWRHLFTLFMFFVNMLFMDNRTLKKIKQLGMNPSTASYKLVKDLLYRMAVDMGHTCYRCGKDLDRSTFSIEHKIAWLDSDNPSGLFFDLNNIAFSHLACNVKASKRSSKPCLELVYNKKGCNCDICLHKRTVVRRENTTYCPEKRAAQYKRTKN